MLSDVFYRELMQVSLVKTLRWLLHGGLIVKNYIRLHPAIWENSAKVD